MIYQMLRDYKNFPASLEVHSNCPQTPDVSFFYMNLASGRRNFSKGGNFCYPILKEEDPAQPSRTIIQILCHEANLGDSRTQFIPNPQLLFLPLTLSLLLFFLLVL